MVTYFVWPLSVLHQLVLHLALLCPLSAHLPHFASLPVLKTLRELGTVASVLRPGAHLNKPGQDSPGVKKSIFLPFCGKEVCSHRQGTQGHGCPGKGSRLSGPLLLRPPLEHEGRHGVPQGPHHLTIGGSAVSGMTLWGRATGQGSCRTVLALPVTFPLSPRCLFPH